VSSQGALRKMGTGPGRHHRRGVDQHEGEDRACAENIEQAFPTTFPPSRPATKGGEDHEGRDAAHQGNCQQVTGEAVAPAPEGTPKLLLHLSAKIRSI